MARVTCHCSMYISSIFLDSSPQAFAEKGAPFGFWYLVINLILLGPFFLPFCRHHFFPLLPHLSAKGVGCLQSLKRSMVDFFFTYLSLFQRFSFVGYRVSWLVYSLCLLAIITCTSALFKSAQSPIENPPSPADNGAHNKPQRDVSHVMTPSKPLNL